MIPPRFRLPGLFAASLLALLPAPPSALAGPVTWICSTGELPWKEMPGPPLQTASPDAPAQLRVWPDKTYQTIEGFGGCFNELGWVALEKASDADRAEVLSALFGDQGCAFNLARLPIGASDFALDGYSLADEPGDLALRSFSLERDKKHLIPFVRAAQKVRPELRCWGSPWSPPAWMKTNNSYSKGSLRWEAPVLGAYAVYLARWIEDYRALGISVYGLSPQNEPNILNVYPTCRWTAEQLREFIGDYLGPTLKSRKIDVELWLGLNGDPSDHGENANARLVTVLEDPKANAFLSGIAFQYDSRTQIGVAAELYPEKKLMQSETECNRGENSWADAQRLYGLMKRYLENGAGSYFAWNMVLDETGMSTWKWRQNALITVARTTGKVTYNGEYQVMRHFSRYVKPGAKRVRGTGPWGDRIAFRNPDGGIVVVVANSSKQAHDFVLQVGGRRDGDTLKASLPAGSVSTFLVAP